jgi:hypothetical protein
MTKSKTILKKKIKMHSLIEMEESKEYLTHETRNKGKKN